MHRTKIFHIDQVFLCKTRVSFTMRATRIFYAYIAVTFIGEARMASRNNHARKPKVVGTGYKALGLVFRRSTDSNVIIARDYHGSDRVLIMTLYKGESKLNI
jgi:hypothetical protein